MDIATIITRLNKGLNGFDEQTAEELDNLYYFDMIGQSILELKKLLGQPVKESQATMTTGNRGITLPDDFMSFQDIERPIRIEPSGQNSEGVFISLVSESEIEY